MTNSSRTVAVPVAVARAARAVLRGAPVPTTVDLNQVADALDVAIQAATLDGGSPLGGTGT